MQVHKFYLPSIFTAKKQKRANSMAPSYHAAWHPEICLQTFTPKYETWFSTLFCQIFSFLLFNYATVAVNKTVNMV